MDKPPLESRWLATLSIAIDPPTAVGPDLLLINVVEARLDGPRIKAKVIPPSGDWVRVQPGGNWNLDVRLRPKVSGEFASLSWPGRNGLRAPAADMERPNLQGSGQARSSDKYSDSNDIQDSVSDFKVWYPRAPDVYCEPPSSAYEGSADPSAKFDEDPPSADIALRRCGWEWKKLTALFNVDSGAGLSSLNVRRSVSPVAPSFSVVRVIHGLSR